MAFDSKRIPDNLREAYHNGRCAVLVGAGASMGAGLPSWPHLLEAMIVQAERHRVIEGDRAGEYRTLLKDSSKYLMIASGLKEDMNTYFDEFFEKTFIDPKPQPTDLHRAIATAEKFQFVLTTNYDTILERAYRSIGKDDVPVCTFLEGGEIQRRLSKREFFILKAHGDAQKAGNGIVLTEKDYRDLIHRQRAYRSLLATMFTMFTVVFVGASMTDPEIKLLLSYIADAFSPTSGPNHYALMAAEDTTGVEQTRWLKDSKVQLIPISKAAGFVEATDFMKALQAS